MTSIPAHQDKKRSAVPKKGARNGFIRHIWPFSYFRELIIAREVHLESMNRLAVALELRSDLLAQELERRDRAASANTTKK